MYIIILPFVFCPPVVDALCWSPIVLVDEIELFQIFLIALPKILAPKEDTNIWRAEKFIVTQAYDVTITCPVTREENKTGEIV